MNYYVRKTAGFISTVFIISIMTFCVFQILPGDPALTILGMDADNAQIERMHASMQHDRPPLLKYVDWLGGALRGDFGESYRYRKPVADIIFPAFTVTAQLALYVLLLTIIIGVPFGILMALCDKSPLSVPFSAAAQLGISIPAFCVSLLFIIVFSVHLHLLPSMGYVTWSRSPVSCIRSLTLPALSITFGTAAVLARYTRASLLLQLQKDYIRTARSKGLSLPGIIAVHAVRNALIPVLTILGMITAEILGGSIIVENVFSLPGLGRLLSNSISSRDYPLIQALVLYLSVIVVICNFITDLLYSAVDPRIRR